MFRSGIEVKGVLLFAFGYARLSRRLAYNYFLICWAFGSTSPVDNLNSINISILTLKHISIVRWKTYPTHTHLASKWEKASPLVMRPTSKQQLIKSEWVLLVGLRLSTVDYRLKVRCCKQLNKVHVSNMGCRSILCLAAVPSPSVRETL